MRFHRACQCGHVIESNNDEAGWVAFGKHTAICGGPAPAVGQRRHCRIVDEPYEIVEQVGAELGIRFERTGSGAGRLFSVDCLSRDWYLGPSPGAISTPSPTPASPAPSAPSSLSSRQTGAGAPHCAAWCGMPYFSTDAVPCSLFGDGSSGVWRNDDERGYAVTAWCSPLCRDERRPPMEERRAVAVPIKNCPHAMQVGLCPLCEAARAAEVIAEIRARVAKEWSAAVREALEARARERAHLERPFVPSVLDEDLFGRAGR